MAVGSTYSSQEPNEVTQTSSEVSEISLSLLGAVPFELHLKKTKSEFKWRSPNRLADLLQAPLKRIPLTVEALESLIIEDARIARNSAIAGLNSDGTSYSLSYQIDGFDGSTLWLEERGERVSGHGKTPTRICGVVVDITEKRRAELNAGFRTSHDDLTGLWNAARFSESLEQAIATVSLRRTPGFLISFTVTNIDDIRQSYGESASNYILQIIAARLKAELGSMDRIARVGHNRFARLSLGTTEKTAKDIGTMFEAWFSQAPLTSPYGDIDVTANASVFSLGQNATSGSDLLKLLSTQTKSIQTPLSEKPHDKIITEDDIISALNERRLQLAYQPIVRASDRTIHHYECLLRYQSQDKLTSAWALILAAEELGLVHMLDQRALELGSKVLIHNPDIHLAFNVSAGTIANESAADNYIQTLSGLGLATKRVTLELTETLAIANTDQVETFVNQARKFGSRFAIDDFGSGHTTFQNLMSIQADMIKIDGTLVRDLTSNPHKQAFIRMMIDFARTFKVKTVAEMVSNEADATLMARLGIDYFQGYMFGLPRSYPIIKAPRKSKASDF